MSDYIEITEPQTDADSPINETLMRGTSGADPNGGMRGNFRNLDARTTVLESAISDSLSPLALKDDIRIAKPLIGLVDNVGEFFRSKFHVFSNINARNRQFITAYDTESIDPNVLLTHLVGQDLTSFTSSILADGYRGVEYLLNKGGKRAFKVKKGLNYFALYAQTSSVLADSITVTIDGVAIDTSPFVDENGDAHGSATFSTVTASNFKQTMVLFVGGLDPDKDQSILVENTTTNVGQTFNWQATEVGFHTPISNNAIGLDDIRLSTGKAIVRGKEIKFPETDLSFNASSGYGKTDLVALKSDATSSIKSGAECAMGTIRAKTLVSDTDTSIKLKTSFYFPTKGIAHIQNPYGNSIIASFTSKTETNPEAHSLDGVLFEQNFEPITVEDTFLVTAGSTTGNMIVNLLANGDNGITISAANNKLDFTIEEDGGAPASFVATIPSGFYTADLMPLGKEIVRQMDAIHALPDKQSYFVEYDALTHLWIIGIRGKITVDTFTLDFLTGPSTANSVHTDLGFSTTDQTGKLSYIATVEKEHLAVRCFDRGHFEHASSPKVKGNNVRDLSGINSTINDIESRWGLTSPLSIITKSGVFHIFPDNDSVGIEFSIAAMAQGSMITAQIDNGDYLYAIQTDKPMLTQGDRGSVLSFFVTYPKVSHMITIRNEELANFELNATSSNIIFVGFRELYAHAPLEKLTTSESALPDFYSIRPLKLFVENYAANYISQSNAFEKINSIDYIGSWTNIVSPTIAYSGEYRATVTQNDFVDVTFTLTGNGGGIGFQRPFSDQTGNCKKCVMYLVSGAVGNNDATNLIAQQSHHETIRRQQLESFQHIGLKAGQYTLRIRYESPTATQLIIDKFNIYDTVESEPDAAVLAEVTNTKKALSVPHWGVIHQSIMVDNMDRITPSLLRTGFKDGIAVSDYKLTSDGNFANANDQSSINIKNRGWFGSYGQSNSVAGEFFASFALCESMWTRDTSFTTGPTAIIPSIDGRDENNTYNQRVHSKNAVATTTLDTAEDTPLFKKNFFRKFSANLSVVGVIPMNDTRGVRIGQVVRLSNDVDADAEYLRVTGIIADVSVAVAKGVTSITNYTTVNNATINFAGLHRIKVTGTGAMTINSISYLVLQVQKQRHRDFSSNVGEVARATEYDLVTGNNLPIPVYKDGRLASYDECIVHFHEITTTTHKFLEGFFDITGSMSVTVVAIRKS